MNRLAATHCLILVSVLMSATHGKPRQVRSTSEESEYVTVTTQYGDIRGRNYNLSDSLDLNVFLGVPYAKPPVGELRLARPQPIESWSPDVHNATVHGAKCVQRVIASDPVLADVPFSEDCLFIDIYATRNKLAAGANQPVMVYLHPGGFYGGSGAKYNYTNLALKGVVVVSVSFRLDMFGYLSTQDDVIPGNFGLLDAALALEFVKAIIEDFGGNPQEITLFGASSGASMVSILTLSPLTRGKFQRAIIQSGGALCPWSVFTPGRTMNVPADIALALGRRLNCSLPTAGSKEDVSRDLLACLRAADVHTLVQESVAMQTQDYRGNMIFIPVSGDSFGVLPETPEKLLTKTAELVAIPTIVGFTTNDGSWQVPDAEDDGVSYLEFEFIINALIATYFPPSNRSEVYHRVQKAYVPSHAPSLAPVQLRTILINIATDFSMAAYIIKQARLFAHAGDHTGSGKKPGTFVYQFDYRPSYSADPLWHGVGHADEKGLVLGLPPGPDPFNYPNTTAEDRFMAELITTMWSNFAKFGDPTPQPFDWPEGLRWPNFGASPDHQELLLIGVEPKIQKFARNESVVVWTGTSGMSMPSSCASSTLHLGALFCAMLSSLIFSKFSFL